MSLKKNVGQTDRNIRLALAGVLIMLGVWLALPLLSLIGLVALVTGVLGFCPVYVPLKINTNKDADQ